MQPCLNKNKIHCILYSSQWVIFLMFSSRSKHQGTHSHTLLCPNLLSIFQATFIYALRQVIKNESFTTFQFIGIDHSGTTLHVGNFDIVCANLTICDKWVKKKQVECNKIIISFNAYKQSIKGRQSGFGLTIPSLVFY